MSWEIFYLACFLIGVTLSVLSFLGGSFHLPHVHLHVAHASQVQLPHLGHGAAGHAGQATDMPFFNFGTITAFLAWFGGSGYLLTRYSPLTVTAVMLVAGVIGLIGAAFIFWFVVKFLMKHDRELDPADFERVGLLARITSPIREGGTGEITFSLEGTRQVCGARADEREPLPRGVEVVITRYERGIAYVRRYEELAGEKDAATVD